MKCLCHFYSTWNLTLFEENRKPTTRDIDLTARDIGLHSNRNRTAALLPLLINQLPDLSQEVLCYITYIVY